MYKKRSQSWLKHLDFMIIDLLCLNISNLIAFFIRNGAFDSYQLPLFRNMAIMLTIMGTLVSVFADSFDGVLKRDMYREFVCTMNHVAAVMVMLILYLFAIQESALYSRVMLVILTGLYLLTSYSFRMIWKSVLRQSKVGMSKRSMLILTTDAMVDQCVERVQTQAFLSFVVRGIVVMDKDRKGQRQGGLDIVANRDDVVSYICNEWVDEVFIIYPDGRTLSSKLMDQLMQVGVVIHNRLANESSMFLGRKQFVESIAGYQVLTTSMNFASPGQLFVKRLVDICGGLVGCFITLILIVILGPLIKKESPGPIFFVQERVGQNGKRFKMYKFRSMYMDAEERKAELMAKNKISDGFMFKMEEDPRIIGSRILPDGTYKKGIGNFMRDYSLDEFPQFWNVLKGECSLVGTRPPLPKEVEIYELHHHARLAAKPGITGMWQVSGRSNIVDFEEVVRLDTEYINRWNIGLDFEILFKTIKVVLNRSGSM